MVPVVFFFFAVDATLMGQPFVWGRIDVLGDWAIRKFKKIPKKNFYSNILVVKFFCLLLIWRKKLLEKIV